MAERSERKREKGQAEGWGVFPTRAVVTSSVCCVVPFGSTCFVMFGSP